MSDELLDRFYCQWCGAYITRRIVRETFSRLITLPATCPDKERCQKVIERSLFQKPTPRDYLPRPDDLLPSDEHRGGMPFGGKSL